MCILAVINSSSSVVDATAGLSRHRNATAYAAAVAAATTGGSCAGAARVCHTQAAAAEVAAAVVLTVATEDVQGIRSEAGAAGAITVAAAVAGHLLATLRSSTRALATSSANTASVHERCQRVGTALGATETAAESASAAVADGTAAAAVKTMSVALRMKLLLPSVSREQCQLMQKLITLE
jgi:hypothetical protein